jgi:hypothetical protein
MGDSTRVVLIQFGIELDGFVICPEELHGSDRP